MAYVGEHVLGMPRSYGGGPDETMNAQGVDLVVVGGGVFGLSTALEAARRQRRTVVVDRRTVPNPIAASYGPSRKIRSTYLDGHYTRLALEAMAAWRQIAPRTGRARAGPSGTP